MITEATTTSRSSPEWKPVALERRLDFFSAKIMIDDGFWMFKTPDWRSVVLSRDPDTRVGDHIPAANKIFCAMYNYLRACREARSVYDAIAAGVEKEAGRAKD